MSFTLLLGLATLCVLNVACSSSPQIYGVTGCFQQFYSQCYYLRTGGSTLDCTGAISKVKCDNNHQNCTSQGNDISQNTNNPLGWDFLFKEYNISYTVEVELNCQENEGNVSITDVNYMLPKQWREFCTNNANSNCNGTDQGKCVNKDCGCNLPTDGLCNSISPETEMHHNCNGSVTSCNVTVPRKKVPYTDCVVGYPDTSKCSDTYNYCYARWVEVSYKCVNDSEETSDNNQTTDGTSDDDNNHKLIIAVVPCVALILLIILVISIVIFCRYKRRSDKVKKGNDNKAISKDNSSEPTSDYTLGKETVDRLSVGADATIPGNSQSGQNDNKPDILPKTVSKTHTGQRSNIRDPSGAYDSIDVMGQGYTGGQQDKRTTGQNDNTLKDTKAIGDGNKVAPPVEYTVINQNTKNKNKQNKEKDVANQNAGKYGDHEMTENPYYETSNVKKT